MTSKPRAHLDNGTRTRMAKSASRNIYICAHRLDVCISMVINAYQAYLAAENRLVSTIQQYNNTTIQQYNNTTIQQYNNTTIQQYNNTTIQTKQTACKSLAENVSRHTCI
jgi:hypothetical protein